MLGDLRLNLAVVLDPLAEGSQCWSLPYFIRPTSNADWQKGINFEVRKAEVSAVLVWLAPHLISHTFSSTSLASLDTIAIQVLRYIDRTTLFDEG